eukprot:123710-Pyramimonas_sp.AAC.1
MVEVLNEGSGDVAIFPCDKWLDSTEGDKKTERQLLAGVGDADASAAVTPETAVRVTNLTPS